VHFARNLLALVPKSHKDMVAAVFRTIFAQPNPGRPIPNLQRAIEQSKAAGGGERCANALHDAGRDQTGKRRRYGTSDRRRQHDEEPNCLDPAVPAIADDLGASIAALLLVSGALADRYGRRRVVVTPGSLRSSLNKRGPLRDVVSLLHARFLVPTMPRGLADVGFSGHYKCSLFRQWL